MKKVLALFAVVAMFVACNKPVEKTQDAVEDAVEVVEGTIEDAVEGVDSLTTEIVDSLEDTAEVIAE